MNRIHHTKIHYLIVRGQQLFGIDLRSLAIFRIGIAAIVVIDLICRAADLEAHYTDVGVLPVDAVTEYALEWWALLMACLCI